MKQKTKAKILSKVNAVRRKAVVAAGSAAAAANAMALSAFAADGTVSGGSSSSLSSALANVDPNVVLSGFYEVLPTVLTIALPIIGAKVALNFLFGSVKGA